MDRSIQDWFIFTVTKSINWLFYFEWFGFLLADIKHGSSPSACYKIRSSFNYLLFAAQQFKLFISIEFHIIKPVTVFPKLSLSSSTFPFITIMFVKLPKQIIC